MKHCVQSCSLHSCSRVEYIPPGDGCASTYRQPRRLGRSHVRRRADVAPTARRTRTTLYLPRDGACSMSTRHAQPSLRARSQGRVDDSGHVCVAGRYGSLSRSCPAVGASMKRRIKKNDRGNQRLTAGAPVVIKAQVGNCESQ